MQTHTTIRSWPSIIVGLACASATALVLLEDVRQGAEITTTHLLSVFAILVTLCAGHWAWSDLSSRRWFSGVALAILSLAGTSYIVVASGARNAEHAAARSATVEARNSARAVADADIRRARSDHALAKADEAKECTRIGPQCEKRRKAVDAAWAHVLAQENRRATMGPAEAVNGGWAHAARVLAAVPGVSADAKVIEDKLILLMPFILVILAEFGTILFIARGLGTYPPSGGVDVRTDGPVPSPDSPAVRLPTYTETIRSVKADRRTEKEEALAYLTTQLALGRTFPSQDTLAGLWNRPKQTVSDWLKEWSEAGLIPTPRRTVGRFKMLSMA